MMSTKASFNSITNILRSPPTIRDQYMADFELLNPRLTNTVSTKNLINIRQFKNKTKIQNCNSVFIKMIQWVPAYNIRNGVKIICPECSAIVGFGKSTGLKCSCSHWQKPGVQLIKQFCKVKIH